MRVRHKRMHHPVASIHTVQSQTVTWRDIDGIEWAGVMVGGVEGM